MTNPLVTWLPATAAAALLIAAGYVMTTDGGAPYSDGADDEDFPRTEDPDEQAAEKDDDGREMLAVMEDRLVQAHRILTTAKDTKSTAKGWKAMKSLKYHSDQELNKLLAMKNNVSNEVFERGHAITNEIKELSDELTELRAEYQKQYNERQQQQNKATPGPKPYMQQAYSPPAPQPKAYAPPAYNPPAPQAYSQPAPQAYAQPAPQAYSPPAPQRQAYDEDDDPEKLDVYRGEEEDR